MLPTKLPEPLETNVRFAVWSCPQFTVYGDVYSNKRLFLHLDWHIVPKALPSVFHELTKAIAAIKTASKEAGFIYLNVLVPEDLVKFESVMGFTVVNVYTEDDKVVAVHMMQETK